MRVQSIDIFKVAIPLRIQFAQANSQTQTSDSVIVKLQTDQGTLGFGESCPRTYVTGESTDDAIKSLYTLYPDLSQQTFDSILDIQQYTCYFLPAFLKPAAICALELALLDAWSKEYQTPLLSALDGDQNHAVNYTGVVPFGKWESLEPILKQFHFKEIKLKANSIPEDNLKRIQQLKKLYSQGVNIRMDANCGWSFPIAMEQCKALIEADVSCIEQPFHPENDQAMATLTRQYGQWIDIMADESLTDYQSTERLITKQACNRFNFKLSKNGGLLNTLRMYNFAQSHNIKCQLGAHFGETSILTAAGYLFANLAPKLEAVEGGLGTHLLQHDITDKPLMINSEASIYHTLHDSCGWGITVNEDFLPAPEKNTINHNFSAFLVS